MLSTPRRKNRCFYQRICFEICVLKFLFTAGTPTIATSIVAILLKYSRSTKTIYELLSLACDNHY